MPPSSFLVCPHKHTPHCWCGSHRFISASFLSPWFVPSSPSTVFFFPSLIFLITGIYFILDWKWVISASSTFQSTVDCQITNSLKECCSDHPISYPGLWSALRSFDVKNTHSSFCQIPNFTVIFLVISICWNIICHHLLLNSLAWTGNLEMPPLMMSFVVHLSGSFRNKDYLKIQGKANLFRKNRGLEDFNGNLLFHPWVFPL